MIPPPIPVETTIPNIFFEPTPAPIACSATASATASPTIFTCACGNISLTFATIGKDLHARIFTGLISPVWVFMGPALPIPIFVIFSVSFSVISVRALARPSQSCDAGTSRRKRTSRFGFTSATANLVAPISIAKVAMC